MTYSRVFIEPFGSEDSHGRALWALGAVAGRSPERNRRALAKQMFHAGLPATLTFSSPRAWAYTLLGSHEYLRGVERHPDVAATRVLLMDKLWDVYQRSSDAQWPWFEQGLSYANARLSQALLLCGEALENREMKGAALSSLAWLLELQRSGEGYFAPIGSNGFYRRGETKAAYDQQPIEACAMVSACLEAARITEEPRWAHAAVSAFSWFLGFNELQQPLYDSATGGCRDGLHRDRPNENQGAESTLSFLLALAEMHSADRVQRVAAAQAAPSRGHS